MIRVDRLGKKFKIYPRRSGRLVEWLTLGRATRHQDFWALKDVSFNLSRGGSLGIIGVNGSGKSTLLKILSGAMYPTDGTFEVGGRVLSLLELGTGLNTELTGRQNIINSAALLGFPPDYARQRLGQIEAFAELGEFFDRPVRLYSSGMLVRLSFSMFACFDPEIFIVDEALSVGDVFFQQKCARRIQEMRANGTTMLFVSHDLAAVEALCDRVLLFGTTVIRRPVSACTMQSVGRVWPGQWKSPKGRRRMSSRWNHPLMMTRPNPRPCTPRRSMLRDFSGIRRIVAMSSEKATLKSAPSVFGVKEADRTRWWSAVNGSKCTCGSPQFVMRRRATWD
jgi:ABC-type polysaccharide/polyol phosphate transport system ATPase subunit